MIYISVQSQITSHISPYRPGYGGALCDNSNEKNWPISSGTALNYVILLKHCLLLLWSTHILHMIQRQILYWTVISVRTWWLCDLQKKQYEPIRKLRRIHAPVNLTSCFNTFAPCISTQLRLSVYVCMTACHMFQCQAVVWCNVGLLILIGTLRKQTWLHDGQQRTFSVIIEIWYR